MNLAQLPGREQTPAPPGLSGFPKQGEVYVSPALAELLHKLSVGQLADGAGLGRGSARPGVNSGSRHCGWPEQPHGRSSP